MPAKPAMHRTAALSGCLLLLFLEACTPRLQQSLSPLSTLMPSTLIPSAEQIPLLTPTATIIPSAAPTVSPTLAAPSPSAPSHIPCPLAGCPPRDQPARGGVSQKRRFALTARGARFWSLGVAAGFSLAPGRGDPGARGRQQRVPAGSPVARAAFFAGGWRFLAGVGCQPGW